MTNLYVWLKFLHLVGLGVFLVGHGVSAGASLALRKQQAAAVRAALLMLSIRSHYVAFPGLLLVLITGVWMGFLGSWWRTGWIWAAIAVLVVLTVVMLALSAPYHLARDVLGEDQPPGELDSRLKRSRPLALTWTGVVGLVLILFLMVFKPF